MDDDVFLLETSYGLPVRIIENLEKTGRSKNFQMQFDLHDPSHLMYLFDLLNCYAFELGKYRKYFRDNKINNQKILYGDER